MTLKTDDFVGAWRLVAAEQVFADGERAPEFGPAAIGYLCYSPDGIVSATLGSSSRPATLATDPQTATDSDIVEMARNFIAYAGPFSVDSERDTVTHHVEVALFTGWQAGAQLRHARFDGDTLRLTGTPRTSSDGRDFHVELVWTRVSSSSALPRPTAVTTG